MTPQTRALRPTAQGPGDLQHSTAFGGNERSSPVFPCQLPQALGSALSASASVPEGGTRPDFFAKHRLNFVTSKAAAALPGAVYIALWLRLPAQKLATGSLLKQAPRKYFCVLAKLVAKLLLHSCHVAAASCAPLGDLARCLRPGRSRRARSRC